MQPAVIFANGTMETPANYLPIIKSSPLVISVDGGIKNCLLLGLQPNVIIGDLDSMPSDQMADFREKGVEVLQYPTRKDETDLELALRFIIEKKYEEVIILGALGARWDMTIANILLLAHAMYRKINLRILDGLQELILVRTGIPAQINGSPGDTISLIPLAGDAAGITTSGLEYPLTNETLIFGATRGVSNILTNQSAEVFIKEGLILCVVNREGAWLNYEQDKDEYEK